MEHRPAGSDWQPLMVLYLTDMTTPEDIREAKDSGLIFGCKYYPAGATTNSDSGVTNLHGLGDVFAAMQEVGLVLQLHGEVTDSAVDIFDREAVFIERYLGAIAEQFPQLKIILEHVTTEQGINFVRNSSANVAATITPQHLLYNRNDMLVGGIRPHAYCLPVAKRRLHKLALRKAAVSGNPKFFLGTDTAPHERHAKESACGCAGIFSAPVAIESYAQTFDEEGALDKLEGFASAFGPAFYRLPLNEGTITLKRQATEIPAALEAGDIKVVPFHAGEKMSWRLVES